MAEQGVTVAEGDGADGPAADNSLGRLLALSDGVFAIAMTLLALDLRLPDLGTDASDSQLRHALADDWRAYLAFVISFYVVANFRGYRPLAFAPPYGNYGQAGTNDRHIPRELLSRLLLSFRVVFTQDRSGLRPLARPTRSGGSRSLET